MIRNPGGKLSDCAAEMHRHPNTISQIVQTDLFKEYLARRKEEWARDHDYALRARLTNVAERSLDLILETMKKKGDQIPMQRLESLASTTLDRLGYAPASSPSVVVNNNNDSRSQTVVIPGLTPQALEEARSALRLAEQHKAGSSLLASSLMPPSHAATLEEGAEILDLRCDPEVGASVEGGIPSASIPEE